MRTSFLVASAMLLVPATLTGQSEAAEGSVDATLGLTTLAGNAVATAGARFWIHFSDQWSLGARGTVSLRDPGGGDLEGSGLEAEFGSGGLVLGFRPDRPVATELRLAVGVGSVALRDRVTGTTVDTEAFWVLTPALAWAPLERGPARIGAEAGYRIVFGADGLTRLDSSDLFGPTLSLSVTLSLF